jgi:hypothetical protein
MALSLRKSYGVSIVSKPKRGGDVKTAPPGFYRALEVRKILDVDQSALMRLVERGVIRRVVPPTASEGVYPKEDVNRLARKNALFYLQNESRAKFEPTVFARATGEDIEGIYEVVASLWGADKAAPMELRRSWYRVNDRIDYVVKFRELVLGYINIGPYRPDVLEDLMSGRKRGWDIRAIDLLPFVPGQSYDTFIGIAVRQDIPGSEYYAKRLIYGFFGALCDMAREGIIIRRMFATSDQEFGIKISQDLGFVRQPAQPGDLFGRFMLDMETADSLVVRKYRDAVARPINKRNKHALSQRVKHDPRLEETLQHLLDMLGGSIPSPQVVAVLMPLIDQLAESPQMTITQQVLLKSIYEKLIQHTGEGNTQN